MAIGFPPRFEDRIPLNGLTPALFLQAAQHVFAKLNWEVTTKSATNISARTPYSFASSHEKITLLIDGDSALFSSISGSKQLLDWGKNKANYFSFIHVFQAIEQHNDIEQNNPAQFIDDSTEEPEDQIGISAIFKPRKGFIVTPILIYSNVLIFILMAISGVHIFEPDTESLITWGANYAPVTLNGAWWRLFTSCFLHIGLLHLLFNMYALLYIGFILEPLIGSARFGTTYVLAGVAASTTSLYWNDFVVSAGASGAVFGMYGVFLALLLFKVVSTQVRQQLFTSILLFVGFNLLYGMQDGIDNAAHVGGLLTGLFLGSGLVPLFKNTLKPQGVAYIMLGQIVLILALCQFIYFSKDNVAGIYDTKIAEFGRLEDQALDILRYADETDIPKLERKLNQEGVALWEQACAVIAELDELNLPDNLQAQNQRFMRYCNLRIKSYQCIARSLTDTTGAYEDSIVYYQRTIDELFLQPE